MKRISKAGAEAARAAWMKRIRRRAPIIERIADRADQEKSLANPTQAVLDKLWPEQEVWQRSRRHKVYTKDERDYLGSRANEDKATIVRREVRRVLSKLPPLRSVSELARRGRPKLTLPPGVPLPSERTLRRLITRIRTED